MRIFLSIVFIFSFRFIVFACCNCVHTDNNANIVANYACEHTYDADVIALIEAEGDTYSDDYLYTKDDLQTQMIYGISMPNPKKILQQAQYAFDTFRYRKCLEKIKEYERVAFPPPYDFPSPEEKLTILAYKAYSNRFLKKYDSAINYFEDMIDIIKKTNHLAPECIFITYLEHAHCYLLKGDKEEYQYKVKKIIDMDIAPKYDYYVENNFKIHHQPCFHIHELKYQERMFFKEIAPKLLGKELCAIAEEKEGNLQMRTVGNHEGDKEFCRRMCGRASYVCVIIIGCISQKPLAIAATWALGELLLDCENCCNEGWGSKNCCKDIKQVFEQVCQQHLLDDL